MARRLRIQYGNALYHVINRGNYRRDVFSTEGAAKAFEAVVGEACERHAWRLHAYVVMGNHFHLALETPQPNLVEGMHWLQSTFATRFNRFRSEHGHLFQGRYQAILVEDADALCRLIHYIHLNPVRTKIVPVSELAVFRPSSLPTFLGCQRPAWLIGTEILQKLRLEDTAQAWARYVEYLTAVANNPAEQEKQQFGEMDHGWAIGTLGWKRAIAREYSQLKLQVGRAADEIQELKDARWSEALALALADCRKGDSDIVHDEIRAPWKIAIAARLRSEVAAPYQWISTALNAGHPGTLRASICRRAKLQRATA